MYAWACRKMTYCTLIVCVLFVKSPRNGFFFNHVARAYMLGTPLMKYECPRCFPAGNRPTGESSVRSRSHHGGVKGDAGWGMRITIGSLHYPPKSNRSSPEKNGNWKRIIYFWGIAFCFSLWRAFVAGFLFGGGREERPRIQLSESKFVKMWALELRLLTNLLICSTLTCAHLPLEICYVIVIVHLFEVRSTRFRKRVGYSPNFCWYWFPFVAGHGFEMDKCLSSSTFGFAGCLCIQRFHTFPLR